MAAFIFLCDGETEQECLDRSLFGTNPGEAHRFHYSKVETGDTLFLYNLDSGLLHGPFVARSACTMNIERDAWKKSRRSFPWQVRVDGSGCSGSPLSASDLQRFVPLQQGAAGLTPPRELDDDQESAVLAAILGPK